MAGRWNGQHRGVTWPRSFPQVSVLGVCATINCDLFGKLSTPCTGGWVRGVCVPAKYRPAGQALDASVTRDLARGHQDSSNAKCRE